VAFLSEAFHLDDSYTDIVLQTFTGDVGGVPAPPVSLSTRLKRLDIIDQLTFIGYEYW
jgi:hypothetical protein